MSSLSETDSRNSDTSESETDDSPSSEIYEKHGRRLSIKPQTPNNFKAKIMNIFGVFRTIGSVTAKKS